MKKQICAAIAACVISTATMADLLGVYAGIDYRTSETSYSASENEFQDSNNLSAYIAVEHFIPLLPNAKIKYTDLSSEYSVNSSEFASSSVNAILYYQLFDNDLFEFNFGFAYTRVETDFLNLSTELGQVYGAAKVQVPGVAMHAFAEMITGSISDDNATDTQLGLAYTFNPDAARLTFSARAGYRSQEVEFSHTRQKNNGLFAGLEAHF